MTCNGLGLEQKTLVTRAWATVAWATHNAALAHPGPRGIKATLRSAFFTPSFYRRYMDSGTPSGVVPTSPYKATIKQIHTDVVSRTMAGLPPKKVLNTRPLLISTEEQSLPRAPRITFFTLGLCLPSIAIRQPREAPLPTAAHPADWRPTSSTAHATLPTSPHWISGSAPLKSATSSRGSPS